MKSRKFSNSALQLRLYSRYYLLMCVKQIITLCQTALYIFWVGYRTYTYSLVSVNDWLTTSHKAMQAFIRPSEMSLLCSVCMVHPF
jgi:hypothetical protein